MKTNLRLFVLFVAFCATVFAADVSVTSNNQSGGVTAASVAAPIAAKPALKSGLGTKVLDTPPTIVAPAPVLTPRQQAYIVALETQNAANAAMVNFLRTELAQLEQELKAANAKLAAVDKDKPSDSAKAEKPAQ